MMSERASALCLLLSSVILLVSASALPAAEVSVVRVWEENMVIPTYPAGSPELNPMFYLGRQSQGAEGRIYPYPFYDTLTGRKVDKTYKMVYLENEYIRIGILPEIGGRLFEGVDKTNGYNFFYRQHVIKPALIGLIGAWISGGIEWNIPHHHRASTFLPVQYSIEESADGSKTVWVGELEVRHRMRWAVGYTLRPGKAYLEAQVRIDNRTPVANTMLCFANVAVHANENYQVLFPPGTQYATFHGKREFTAWPFSTSKFAGADFTKGVDVSWYKNNISSNSYFAWNYEDDFFAGYDHGKQAGVMSVADHHVTPGKKLWTWGTGPRGKSWDKILTDEDGPYIELMVGAYSDNQPDYSWLQPFEVKSFSLNWYPFRDIGGVKKANLDAAVNLDVAGGTARVGFYTTSAYPSATAAIKAGDKVLLQETVAINPGKPYLKEVPVPTGVDEHELRASLFAGGRELVSYSPLRLQPTPMPKPVAPYETPQAIKTNEELYLAGLRIEQFHDPNLDPDPYWEEALRRDPADTRVNTALGISYFKKARFADAERLFRKALERLTDRYTSPKDGEAYYYLGLTLKALGKDGEAFDHLYKSTWSLAWRAGGYYTLAELAAKRGDLAEAMDLVDRSIEANALNIRAQNLKAALLRRIGRMDEALQVWAFGSYKVDPLDVRAMAEHWLASKSPEAAKMLTRTMNEHPATAQETAAEYLSAGLWQDGADVLSQVIAAAPDKSRINAMVYYYLGYFAARMGRGPEAARYYQLGASMPTDYVFPFQYEAIEVLRDAMKVNSRDARAPYYLGNLLYDWQPGEAMKMWEASAALDPSYAIVHRNLAVAAMNRESGVDLNRAVAELEKAVECDRKYALHFAELDELYEQASTPVEKRLPLFERNQATVAQRDDATNREIALMVAMGKYDEAIRIMSARWFAVAEGANLNVADQWVNAHLLRGRKFLEAGRYKEAVADFEASAKVPSNIPTESMTTGGRSAELAYWSGIAFEGMGDRQKALESWNKGAAPDDATATRRPGAAAGLATSGSRSYYQARCLQKLGQEQKARGVFEGLVKSGQQCLQESPPGTAPAAGSARRQGSPRARLAAAHYLIGLGQLGLNDREKAKAELAAALEASPDLLDARTALASLK
jgi:tetratricopeptide (TPR) repeat protein